MHTFEGKEGTTIIYNPDLSGEVQITGSLPDGWEAPVKVPGADLLAFIDHLRPGLSEIEVATVAAALMLLSDHAAATPEKFVGLTLTADEMLPLAQRLAGLK